MEFLRKLLSGKDNQTPDIARHVGFWGAISGIGMQGYTVIAQGHPFDIQAFGIGLGALVTAVGAACGLKKDTEPHE